MKTILFLLFKVLLGKTIKVEIMSRVMNMVVSNIRLDMSLNSPENRVSIELVEANNYRLPKLTIENLKEKLGTDCNYSDPDKRIGLDGSDPFGEGAEKK
jgi:hypothetical protein